MVREIVYKENSSKQKKRNKKHAMKRKKNMSPARQQSYQKVKTHNAPSPKGKRPNRMRSNRKNNLNQQHPQFLAGYEETWVDKERRRERNTTMRNVIRLIILGAVILVLLIAATVTNIMMANHNTSTEAVSASSSYAISNAEEENIKTTAKGFVTSYLATVYLNNTEEANAARQTTLDAMLPDTTQGSKYSQITAMAVGSGPISQNALGIVTTTPEMVNGTRAYTGDFTYQLEATITNKANNNAQIGNRSFEITFTKAYDNNGENPIWLVKDFKSW